MTRKLIVDENVQSGMAVSIGENELVVARPEDSPIGIAARSIKKGEVVVFDPNGNTDDILTSGVFPTRFDGT